MTPYHDKDALRRLEHYIILQSTCSLGPLPIAGDCVWSDICNHPKEASRSLTCVTPLSVQTLAYSSIPKYCIDFHRKCQAPV